MNKDVVRFLEDVKYDFFCFLKNNDMFFPKSAVLSSVLVKTFIEEYFEVDVKAKKGILKFKSNGTNFHVWLEIDDKSIDFSLFQYYIHDTDVKSMTDKEAYKFCIELMQVNDVIFEKKFHELTFTDIEVVNIGRSTIIDFVKNIDLSINKELYPHESFLNYINKFKQIVK